MNSRNGDVLGIIHNSPLFKLIGVELSDLGTVLEDIHECVMSLTWSRFEIVEDGFAADFAPFRSGGKTYQ
jgi:hypothetical protein